MRAAGSTPGVAKKIRNTSTLSANMTSTVAISRRMMNAITRSGSSATGRPILSRARGSSASRTPSPSTFRQSTVATIARPGAIATQGRV